MGFCQNRSKRDKSQMLKTHKERKHFCNNLVAVLFYCEYIGMPVRVLLFALIFSLVSCLMVLNLAAWPE